MSRDDTINMEHYKILSLAHKICNVCQKLSKRCPGGLCSNAVIMAKEIYYSQFAEDEKVRANGMREKQKIEEMAKDLQKSEHWYFNDHSVDFELDRKKTAENLYNAGYRKQSEGEWIDKPTGAYSRMQSWCSACGKHSGIGGIESNRHKPFCPNCGAKMKGGAE